VVFTSTKHRNKKVSLQNTSLPVNDIETLVCTSLNEDIATGDITADLIAPHSMAKAEVISRQAAILCGCAWFDAVFQHLDRSISITWALREGEPATPNQSLCQLRGPAQAILTGERTALNLLQTLSATATVTHRYVEAIRGTGVKILDTRKTLPGLRTAQKYAVRCGGGINHRMGLYDGILIKENHIMAAGSIAGAIHAARQQHPKVPVEVETESLGQLRQALEAGADRMLLDNFDIETLREAVALTQHKAKLEASGGVNLNTIRDIAETGVDFISVGALTKNIDAVDLSMRFVLD
jgi:nicotinate-nucleotide pyrophosphorylase (carboxylating)